MNKIRILFWFPVVQWKTGNDDHCTECKILLQKVSIVLQTVKQLKKDLESLTKKIPFCFTFLENEQSPVQGTQIKNIVWVEELTWN